MAIVSRPKRLGKQAHAGAVPEHELNPVGSLGPEYMGRTRERVGPRGGARERRRAVHSFAEVAGLALRHAITRTAPLIPFASVAGPDGITNRLDSGVSGLTAARWLRTARDGRRPRRNPAPEFKARWHWLASDKRKLDPLRHSKLDSQVPREECSRADCSLPQAKVPHAHAGAKAGACTGSYAPGQCRLVGPGLG